MKPDLREVTSMLAWISAALLILLVTAPCFARDDIREHRSCKFCGMNRETFSYSRMFLRYTDTTTVGTCSLHCTAIELTVNMSLVPCDVMVGDYATRKLIEAASAHWVIGGDRPGVMTQRAKWAFADKADAQAFTRLHGGKIVTFNDALQAAYEDLYGEVKMTMERATMRKTKLGSICDPPDR